MLSNAAGASTTLAIGPCFSERGTLLKLLRTAEDVTEREAEEVAPEGQSCTGGSSRRLTRESLTVDAQNLTTLARAPRVPQNLGYSV